MSKRSIVLSGLVVAVCLGGLLFFFQNGAKSPYELCMDIQIGDEWSKWQESFGPPSEQKQDATGTELFWMGEAASEPVVIVLDIEKRRVTSKRCHAGNT